LGETGLNTKTIAKGFTFNPMNTRYRMLISLISLSTLLLVGCTPETFESYYDTHEVAKRAGALQSGWLPTWLPPESKKIYERHNIDTNARMWSAEVPIGAELALPSSCVAFKQNEISKPPMETSWWPLGEPIQSPRNREFFYFKCKTDFVGLAVAGGRLIGWATAQ
jgi:hypothetical protein